MSRKSMVTKPRSNSHRGRALADVRRYRMAKQADLIDNLADDLDGHISHMVFEEMDPRELSQTDFGDLVTLVDLDEEMNVLIDLRKIEVAILCNKPNDVKEVLRWADKEMAADMPLVMRWLQKEHGITFIEIDADN